MFGFLSDLAANNDRAWFQANKARYVDQVEAPMQRFVADAGLRLAELSPSYAGGSLFRIYRDTRFSRDRAPFKTSTAAQFRHGTGRKEHSLPGFYLHLAPGHCVGGGGLYHPDPAALGRVRDRIVARPDEWAAVLASGVTVLGDQLKRPPAGYPPDHRFVDDLRRKDHFAMVSFTEAEVCRPDFLDAYAATCAGIAPLMAFLTRSLDLTW
ncbi:MAG TPA: DUF2461 domain-containing protein [Chloroflexota bacterium]